MDFSGAIGPHPHGCILRFEVVPNSASLAVPSGFNQWRNVFQAKLTEKADRGKANLQLTIELARVLSVNVAKVSLLSGHRSSKKVLLVQGIIPTDASYILKSKLEKV